MKSAVLFFVAAMSLIGCSAHMTVKPIPVIYEAAKVNLCTLVPESKRSPDVEVFYATNRVGKGDADDRTYANSVDDKAYTVEYQFTLSYDKNLIVAVPAPRVAAATAPALIPFEGQGQGGFGGTSGGAGGGGGRGGRGGAGGR